MPIQNAVSGAVEGSEIVLHLGALIPIPYSYRHPFETAFAEAVGANHAVAVTNGTAALHLAAVALGIGPGDEVICPSLTFVASAAAMRQAGATVRFADSSSLDDFSLDPSEIERLAGPAT